MTTGMARKITSIVNMEIGYDFSSGDDAGKILELKFAHKVNKRLLLV